MRRALAIAAWALAAAGSANAQDPAHGGHDHGAHAPSQPPVQKPTFGLSPPPPPAKDHLADAFHDPAVMAAERARLRLEHGGGRLLIGRTEKFEARADKGDESFAWQGRLAYGGDIDRLMILSEGEGAFGGRLERAEVQGLWAHAVDPFFDARVGVRQDLRGGGARTYATVGVAGLAPYRIEVESAVFLSDEGRVSARLEAAYDLRLTPQLVLQPRGELDLAKGREGGSSLEIGARLRYELGSAVAPYVGVEHEEGLGRMGGETRAVAGLRALF